MESSRPTRADPTQPEGGVPLGSRYGVPLQCRLTPKSAYARKEGAHITEIVRAAVRNGERQDLPIDLDEDNIQAAGQTLFINKDEVIPLTDGRWLSLRTRVTEDQHVLALVSDITAMKEAELSLKSFAERMKGLAETDALTGLANRRSFDEALLQEFEKAKKTGQPLAVLLIDVDRFKAYNDRRALNRNATIGIDGGNTATELLRPARSLPE